MGESKWIPHGLLLREWGFGKLVHPWLLIGLMGVSCNLCLDSSWIKRKEYHFLVIWVKVAKVSLVGQSWPKWLSALPLLERSSDLKVLRPPPLHPYGHPYFYVCFSLGTRFSLIYLLGDFVLMIFFSLLNSPELENSHQHKI